MPGTRPSPVRSTSPTAPPSTPSRRNSDRCDVLVNNAGGALGADPVATATRPSGAGCTRSTCIGVLHLTQALLPALIESPCGEGTVLVVSSTAGHATYEGGGGYVAAKHGAHVLAETLRLELCGSPYASSRSHPAWSGPTSSP